LIARADKALIINMRVAATNSTMMRFASATSRSRRRPER
jgi:hypothetical protein